MLEIFEKGGPVFWLIVAVGMGALVVIIERFLFFRSAQLDERKLQERLKGALDAGRHEETLALAASNQSALAGLLRTAIVQRQLADNDRRDAIENAAAQEILRMENHLHILQTIGHIGPLLGLLGTVTGIINAFGLMGAVGVVSDPTVLARGISEALINTVGGIAVAIPSVVFYNYFVRRVHHLSVRLEQQTSEIVLALAGRSL